MSEQIERVQHLFLTAGTILLVLIGVSCKGQDYGILQPTPEDLCKCLPIEPDIADYRHLAKHVPIPNIATQDVTLKSFSVGHKTHLYRQTRHVLDGSLRFFTLRTRFYRP